MFLIRWSYISGPRNTICRGLSYGEVLQIASYAAGAEQSDTGDVRDTVVSNSVHSALPLRSGHAGMGHVLTGRLQDLLSRLLSPLQVRENMGGREIHFI